MLLVPPVPPVLSERPEPLVLLAPPVLPDRLLLSQQALSLPVVAVILVNQRRRQRTHRHPSRFLLRIWDTSGSVFLRLEV